MKHGFRKPLSLRHPWLYVIRVWQRRLFRRIEWALGRWRFATRLQTEPLPYRYYRHSSRLLRKLGVTDMQLQHNKVINLKAAVPLIDGVLIAPGETFSFCKLVGLPTRKRGFVEGLELSFGKAQKGVGGGICQIANLLHWLTLHSPLQVTARSNHSFDPFPDEGRVLPFATGAAIFYNFVDLMFYNPTQETLQFRLWLTDENLEGEVRTDTQPKLRYHVYQKEHQFFRQNDQVYRRNQIWRDVHKRDHGAERIDQYMLYSNCVRVMYEVDEELLAAI